MSSCRTGLHREPPDPSSFTCQHVKWLSGTHLELYHKLQKRESPIEIRSNRGMHLNNQSSAKEEKCKGSPRNGSSNEQPRRPLGAISQNTMCNTAATGPTNGFEVRTKNVQSAEVHPGVQEEEEEEDEDGPLDICAIIKPGNTKEKIAFFAAHHYSNDRNSSMKIKCTGDMNGRAAKRRKKSVDLKKVKNQLEKMQEVRQKYFLSEPYPHGVENCSINCATDCDGIITGRPLSVIEIVASLEQRASALISDCAKSLTNHHASRLGASKCSLPGPMSLPLGACEELLDTDCSDKTKQESVCVLEMVAKLEYECLRRQSERDSGGLSRSNSFRRNVGRMLLTSGPQPDINGSLNLSAAQSDIEESMDPPLMEESMLQNKDGSFLVKSFGNCAQVHPQEEHIPPVEDLYAGEEGLELVGGTYFTIRTTADAKIVDPCKYSSSVAQELPAMPNICPRAVNENVLGFCDFSDPVIKAGDVSMHTLGNQAIGCKPDKPVTCDPSPGTLFFQHDQTVQNHAHIESNCEVKLLAELQKENAFDNTLCIQNSLLIAQSSDSISSLGSVSQVLDTSSLKKTVSQDFLETRFKIQQLLEPQQYVILLPHHILVKIFRFLPTRTLAALKCTSCYFKFIIEHYDIRPSDSLWVRDPRYKDDPCKQCKKKYVKGDVSLCWWHPKPYCQALPYGPGYWMCCHMSPKESRGCKVGLHDNRWVPACHTLNRSICKKSESEEDQ
ncbi:F-box only protein 34 [Spea bombifrons]|uniref:F-box only protein 34 n=1 Tax=Spea bombifrons TaxID=233779 RepID=UPI002348FA7C|nr:F-box only protein 34 [Spea bombifrons]